MKHLYLIIFPRRLAVCGGSDMHSPWKFTLECYNLGALECYNLRTHAHEQNNCADVQHPMKEIDLDIEIQRHRLSEHCRASGL